MSMRFDDHVVWITGGGSGIGRALALEFARRGADVAVSGRRVDKLEAVVREIEGAGRRGLAVPCDVPDDDQVARAVESVAGQFGRIDVAVANAGRGVLGPFEDLTGEMWRGQFDVNLFGAVNTARRALPELRKTRGRMVFVGSVAGLICMPGNSAYSASKFAVRAVALTLAQELKGSGVTSTIIHPGFVASDITKIDNLGGFHSDYEDRRPGMLVWPADRAARVMVRAAAARKREFTFTGHGRIGAFLGKHFPGIVHGVAHRLSL